MAEPGEGVCGQGLGHTVFESLVAHGSRCIRRVLGELHGIGVDGPLRIEGLRTHVGVGYHRRLTCGALGVGEPSAECVAGLRDVLGTRQDRSVSEEVVRHVIAVVDRASVPDQGHVEPREEYGRDRDVACGSGGDGDDSIADGHARRSRDSPVVDVAARIRNGREVDVLLLVADRVSRCVGSRAASVGPVDGDRVDHRDEVRRDADGACRAGLDLQILVVNDACTLAVHDIVPETVALSGTVDERNDRGSVADGVLVVQQRRSSAGLRIVDADRILRGVPQCIEGLVTPVCGGDRLNSGSREVRIVIPAGERRAVLGNRGGQNRTGSIGVFRDLSGIDRSAVHIEGDAVDARLEDRVDGDVAGGSRRDRQASVRDGRSAGCGNGTDLIAVMRTHVHSDGLD